MNREDVMRMAMRAGLLDKIDCSDHYFIPADAFIDEMEKLANLAYEAGRNDENEACAKVCQQAVEESDKTNAQLSPTEILEKAVIAGAIHQAHRIDAAIRARREQ